jgi:major membrane immunogen (membrane-anchored lipoprotein)
MKKSVILINIIILGFVVAGSSYNSGRGRTISFNQDQDTLRSYKDGTFSGQSQDSYTDEPYWGIVSVSLNNGSFTGVSFIIRDTALNEKFDTLYAKHFQGNELYIQQCRNDWRGVQIYPEKLMKVQEIDKLDAISGATWSYNIFKASVKDALKKAWSDTVRY